MVATYMAGFVIVFAVANVVYKASASLAMKSRTRTSAKLAHASPVEAVIRLGSSPTYGQGIRADGPGLVPRERSIVRPGAQV